MAAVNDAVNCCVIVFEEPEVVVAETVWSGVEMLAAGAVETALALTSTAVDWTALSEFWTGVFCSWLPEWVTGFASAVAVCV